MWMPPKSASRLWKSGERRWAGVDRAWISGSGLQFRLRKSNWGVSRNLFKLHKTFKIVRWSIILRRRLIRFVSGSVNELFRFVTLLSENLKALAVGLDFASQQSKESSGRGKIELALKQEDSVSDTEEGIQASIFWMMGKMFPLRRTFLRFAWMWRWIESESQGSPSPEPLLLLFLDTRNTYYGVAVKGSTQETE